MDLLDQGVRKKILKEILGDENRQRKIQSFKQSQVQSDKIHQYVYENLENKYDKSTLCEMSIIANINLQRRISKQESSIYKTSPTRQFSELNEEQEEVVNSIYQDGKANTKFRKANEIYKYQQQSLMQIIPSNKMLAFRPFKRHHYDVVPDRLNPEIAFAYILSDFNYSDEYDILRKDDTTGASGGDVYNDGLNQGIADSDDEKKETIFTWWSNDYNFFTNAKGEILDKEIMKTIDGKVEAVNFMSPLAHAKIMPFVDIASDKEYQYFIDQGSALYDATITYNTMLTEEQEVVTMQGQAQAYYRGDSEHMPQDLRVGTRKIIFLPVDKNNPINSEFGFVSPSANLADIRQFRESYLATFLSSRGVDSSSVTSSGGDSNPTDTSRLIKMIEKFEASQEDMDIFECVEGETYEIIKAWLATLVTSDLLNNKYKTSVPVGSKVMVEYVKPVGIQTDSEKMDLIERKMERGLYSRVDALVELENITPDVARGRIKEIDSDDILIPDIG